MIAKVGVFPTVNLPLFPLVPNFADPYNWMCFQSAVPAHNSYESTNWHRGIGSLRKFNNSDEKLVRVPHNIDLL